MIALCLLFFAAMSSCDCESLLSLPSIGGGVVGILYGSLESVDGGRAGGGAFEGVIGARCCCDGGVPGDDGNGGTGCFGNAGACCFGIAGGGACCFGTAGGGGLAASFTP